jgi:hypothetical protein
MLVARRFHDLHSVRQGTRWPGGFFAHLFLQIARFLRLLQPPQQYLRQLLIFREESCQVTALEKRLAIVIWAGCPHLASVTEHIRLSAVSVAGEL